MTKALIIGAGIGGLTAAIALARIGFEVEVFEKSARVEDIGGGIQQSPNAMAVWTALGLADKITALSCEPKAGILRDYKTGVALMTTTMRDVYEARYGHKYLHIHRADLVNILLKETQRLGVTIHFGRPCEEVQHINDRVNIIAGQINAVGDILIGADGIKSLIRQDIIGETSPVFTKQVAWRGLVETEKLPKDFIPFAANNWLGPNRHFVSYYVRGGKLINFVAVEERGEWTDQGWRQKADKSELQTAFQGWDNRVMCLIEACEESYLWGLFDHPPLSKWTDRTMTLLGDAAHPMLPFMAQGAAMAIEDGWVLAHFLSKNPNNLEQALTNYETARQPRTSALQKTSRDNAKLYHQSAGFGRTVRNLKFKIGSHVPQAVFARLDKIYGVDVTRDYPISFN